MEIMNWVETSPLRSQTAALAFREANVPLQTEDSKLSQQYQKICGAMTVMHDGEEKTLRDLRGGSWGLNASDCRSASRLSNAGTFRYFDLGLRVVCDLD